MMINGGTIRHGLLPVSALGLGVALMLAPAQAQAQDPLNCDKAGSPECLPQDTQPDRQPTREVPITCPQGQRPVRLRDQRSGASGEAQWRCMSETRSETQSSASAQSANSPRNRSYLADTAWELVYYTNKSITTAPIPESELSRYRIIFNADGTARFGFHCLVSERDWITRPVRAQKGELLLSAAKTVSDRCDDGRSGLFSLSGANKLEYSSRSIVLRSSNNSYHTIWRRLTRQRPRTPTAAATQSPPPPARANDTAAAEAALVGTRWYVEAFTRAGRWVSISPSGLKRDYTISFFDQNTVVVSLDCGRGRGRWSIGETASAKRGDLSLRVGTGALNCEEPSYAKRIAQDLMKVDFFRFAGGTLYLRVKDGDGDLRLKPM